MKAYILCFIISVGLGYISEIYLKGKKKRIGIILLITSLLVGCFISAVRDNYVGTDVNNYPMALYRRYQSGENYIQVVTETGVEPLFSLIVMISSYFNDFHFTLFFIQLFVAAPIYIYAYKKSNEQSITLVIITYMLTMYAKSFNLMRQFIAISFIVLATYYFENKRYKKAFLLYIVAIMFHYSSICCALIFIIVWLTNQKDANLKNAVLFIIVVIILISSIFIDKVIDLIPSKYSFYVDSQYAVSTFSTASLLKNCIWLVMAFMLYWNSNNNKQKNRQLAFLMLAIINIGFYLMSTRVGPFGRLSYYFLFVVYFEVIPNMNKVFVQKGLVNTIVTILLILLWINMTVINNEGDKTYPYKSDVIYWLNDGNIKVE